MVVLFNLHVNPGPKRNHKILSSVKLFIFLTIRKLYDSETVNSFCYHPVSTRTVICISTVTAITVVTIYSDESYKIENKTR